MASATAMASVRVSCLQQNLVGFSNPKVDSARISTAFVKPLRSRIPSFSPLKLSGSDLAGLVLKRHRVESRPSLALSAVPLQSECFDTKPIGLNGSFLPIKNRQVEKSTVCRAAAADAEGDEISIPSGSVFIGYYFKRYLQSKFYHISGRILRLFV